MSRWHYTEWKQAARNFWTPKPHYVESDYPDLTGKTFVITGGHSGVGLAATELLVSKGAKVVLVGRSHEAAKPVLSDLPEGSYDFAEADLADLSTITAAGDYIVNKYPEIHGVILNAGIAFKPYSLTPQGHEYQWGTNVVGHQALMKCLDPVVIKTAHNSPPGSVRIVWVSSSAVIFFKGHGGINFEDINHEKSQPGDMQLYSQSKIGNAYQAYLWSKYHPDSGVVSVSVDPGNLRSNIGRSADQRLTSAVQYLLYPSKYGAYTELAALLAPGVEDGDHLIPWGVKGHLRKDVDDGRRGEKGEELWKRLQEDVKDVGH
ncbi:putative oxidoreductase [Yarrowia sp. C11]|nr:putative oxidoreductase [Yarrowia sp. E02]KAG5369596.1 putative oxidoreductase [Yarrowia sp. C11]